MEQRTRYFRSEDTPKKWYLVDATGRTLGRVASEIARLLRGKHKPTYTPNADLGDFVIVVNASKVKLTGKREELKEYFHFTGYPGGATFVKFQEVLKKHPQRVFEHAVRGMLPHNTLGQHMFRKLKVYAGPDHPHTAQQPEPYSISA